MASSGEGNLPGVSSCLAGVPCRYDGHARADERVIHLAAAGLAVPVCAEVLAGLPTPRPAAEIVGGDGEDVLAGRARVVCEDGTDVTAEFITGARLAAEALSEQGVTHAILQARSPSCGCGRVYDGTHTGRLRAGDGVFAAELKRRGITVEALRGDRAQRV